VDCERAFADAAAQPRWPDRYAERIIGRFG
jgi:hypothetical protein